MVVSTRRLTWRDAEEAAGWIDVRPERVKPVDEVNEW